MDATQGAFESRVHLVSRPTIKSQIERELVLTENFNAHEDTEADNDECQLSHARDVNLGLFTLENFEDHNVDKSSAS